MWDLDTGFALLADAAWGVDSIDQIVVNNMVAADQWIAWV